MDSLFFWLSKLLWLFLSPDSLLLIMLLLAWLLCRRGAIRWARRLLGAVVLLLIVVAVFPVGAWLLTPLEQRFATNPTLPDKVDGIIVLGGAESPLDSHHWNQVELNDSAERLLAFVTLARRYPQAKLVYTGGSGSLLNQQYKGATVAAAFFEDQGLALPRIVFERQSRNTYENALYSSKAISPEAPQNWVLVTTAWHMPRSVGVFCKVGWPTIPFPVDHWSVPGARVWPRMNLANNLRVLSMAVKEWVGLAAYSLSGKTTALFPDQCDWP